MNTYLSNLLNRYATKHFDSNFKVSKQLEDLLDQTLDLAPTSYGLQPFKVIKVVTPKIREKLLSASWDQKQVTDSSIYYVFCVRKDINQKMVLDYIKNISNVRGVGTETLSGYEQMMNGAIQAMSDEQKIDWAKKQTYLVLGFLLDAVAQNGLDSCPMEGFDPVKYSEILELEDKGLVASVCCAVGKRSKDDMYAQMKKVRVGTEKLIITI